MKSKKMIIALAIPFIVIIMFLTKMFHTVESSKDPFVKRGGMVFTKDQYMQNFDAGLPLEKAIYAVVKVRKETQIMKIVNEYTTKNKTNNSYSWLALAVMDEKLENWLVTFREHGIIPKLICQTKVKVDSGHISKFTCEKSDNKTKVLKKVIEVPLVQPVQ